MQSFKVISRRLLSILQYILKAPFWKNGISTTLDENAKKQASRKWSKTDATSMPYIKKKGHNY